MKKQIRACNLFSTEEECYFLILEDVESHEKFGILTLKHEAMHILSFLFEKKPPRPSLYEVFSNYIKEKGELISEIIIDKYVQHIYHAKLICKNIESGNISVIDIKATDAIALSYLNKVPLYIEESILQICSQQSNKLIATFEKKFKTSNLLNKSGDYLLNSLQETVLKQQIQEAIRTENYELASKLKKELEKTQNNNLL